MSEDKKRILIAMQFEEPAKLLVDALGTRNRFPYEFTLVNSLHDAEKHLSDHDAVITGIGNGWDGDGYDFLDHAVKKGYNAIVITGYGNGERARSFARGALGFIPLPISMAVAAEEVERVLRKYKREN